MWVDGSVGGWVDGWMGGWVGGWMGGWVDEMAAKFLLSSTSSEELVLRLYLAKRIEIGG